MLLHTWNADGHSLSFTHLIGLSKYSIVAFTKKNKNKQKKNNYITDLQ